MRTKLQILLKREMRNAQSISEARDLLGSLGITVTSYGAASISADVTPELFESLFGRRSNDEETGAVPIPQALERFVESITIAPPHLYLERPEDEDRRKGE